jgi:hypothetical protein
MRRSVAFDAAELTDVLSPLPGLTRATSAFSRLTIRVAEAVKLPKTPSNKRVAEL